MAVSPVLPEVLFVVTDAGSPNHYMAIVSPGEATLWTSVENDGAIIGVNVFVQPPQHIQHTVYGASRLTRASTQVRHCMKRAIQVRRPVHQQQRLCHLSLIEGMRPTRSAT